MIMSIIGLALSKSFYDYMTGDIFISYQVKVNIIFKEFVSDYLKQDQVKEVVLHKTG